ncbi:MAG: hypothetical protein K6E98_04205, partial [Lachnospiraceae bacterium]|nr:hypothetical protein [Lachnospiraceae bacterium]
EEMQADETYNIKVYEDVSIWDEENDCLKPGYVLYKEATEEDTVTYGIYYNSTLFLADKYNTDKQKARDNNYYDRYGNDYEYYKFDVVYKYYDTSVKETLVDYEDSEETETVSTNGIRAIDHRSITLENGNTVGTNYNESYQFTRTNDKYSDRIYQDTSPLPILSGGIKQGKDAEGNTTYTIKWDEFYRNEQAWNRKLDPDEYAEEIAGYEFYRPYHSPYATEDDYYVANTWTAFANKTGYYTNEEYGTTERKDIMNAYYLTYSHNNSYTVDILGITDEGDEIVLATQVITSDDVTPVEDAYTDKTYKFTNETTGETKEIQKYKKWVYKATFTESSDWIYDSYKIRITNNGSKYCMLEGTSEGYSGCYVGGLYYDSPFDTIDSVDNESDLCYYRLPKYREFELTPRIPFTRLDMPKNVQIKADVESGTYDEGLDYTVTWTGLTDEAELKDLGGYLITAKVMESAKEGEQAKTHYYYVEEIGDEEAVNSSIDLDVAALAENGIVTGADTVSGNYVKDGNNRSLDVDFSDFYDGDLLNVYVNVISRTGASTYCDSEDGVPFEVTVMTAMHAPDVDKTKVDGNKGIPEYEDTENEKIQTVSANSVSANSVLANSIASEDETYPAIDFNTWKEGMWIGYIRSEDTADVTNYYYNTTVSVNAAVAVYSTKPDDALLPGEAADENERTKAITDSASSWNKDAYATLYTKDEPLNLGYVQDGDMVRVVLGSEKDEFGARYAGMWLKIVLMADSNTSINSRWSDQDAAGESVNYKWIHLPYILKGEEAGSEEDMEQSSDGVTTEVLETILVPDDGIIIIEDDDSNGNILIEEDDDNIIIESPASSSVGNTSGDDALISGKAKDKDGEDEDEDTEDSKDSQYSDKSVSSNAADDQ